MLAITCYGRDDLGLKGIVARMHRLTLEYRTILLDDLRRRLHEAREHGSGVSLQLPELHMLLSEFKKVADSDDFQKIIAEDLRCRLQEAQKQEWRDADVTIPELYLLLKVFEQAVGGDQLNNE